MTAEKRQSRIFSALDAHHAIVAEDYDAAMTVLIGSQNYVTWIWKTAITIRLRLSFLL